MKPILSLLEQHKRGASIGLYSICSAHPLVIEAAMRQCLGTQQAVLIEATSNQVNQNGGYTGMTPVDFHAYVMEIAARVGLSPEQIWLGGDHLGPNCWQDKSADEAMQKSEVLIDHYVRAGFKKIHLDCSMSCSDDPVPLPTMVSATRAARLCAVAEKAWRDCGGEAPVYVVGTEVPVPGGAHETLSGLALTTPQDAQATITAHQNAFEQFGLTTVWPRVIALVVQPGVEFDHRHVIDYRPAAAQALSQFIEQDPRLVFEAHSTDYQTQKNLTQLVRDHFAILKVGPAVTFALREALWALSDVEDNWIDTKDKSYFKQRVLQVMRDNPIHWKKYYTDAHSVGFDLQFSLSDRIRYYWSQPDIITAQNKLFGNLEKNLPPLALISQYLPLQYEAIRAGQLRYTMREIVMHAIGLVINQYRAACGTK